MADYASFRHVLRERYGRNWCIAQRMTDQLRDRGYEAAIHPKTYAKLKATWVDNHPVWRCIAADTPEHLEIIKRAVRRELECMC